MMNENDGHAIQAMDQSATVIRDNLKVVDQQLEKLSVY